MKVKKLWKKVLTIALAAVIGLSTVPVMTVQAKGETWTHTGDGWHYLDGTDVAVYYSNGVMKVTGTGAIPDYDYWTLYERPWAKSGIEYLYIDGTITYIGSYAFAGMDKLKYINMSTSTFIADTTVFKDIAYMPTFRLTGKEEKTEYIGTIPYTSLDSIKKVAQTNYNGACYILDTRELAEKFQNSTNPTISNVYYATDKKAPWNDIEKNGNGNVLTPICKLSDENPDPSVAATGQKRFQGKAAYEAFAAFIGDYIFGETYQIDVMKGTTKVTRTAEERKYVLTIPERLRSPGRSFRLLAIGEGVVNIYDDLDSNDNTITFATTTPSTVYALVYK